MATWALNDLGLIEVLGIVGAANLASCRVLEKAGFSKRADELGKAGAIRVYSFVTK